MNSQTTGTSSPTREVSRETGRYLLELYFASIDADDRVRTGALSERLDVRPASVTGMLSKLAERNLVDYRKHEGATLTAAGEEIAEMLVWRYCVTDRFFTEAVEAPVDRAVAYRIGFELPLDGLLTLAETVDMPCMRACPHLDENAVHNRRSEA
jgi:DtxR family Mn-dependent transcriptional regulator